MLIFLPLLMTNMVSKVAKCPPTAPQRGGATTGTPNPSLKGGINTDANPSANTSRFTPTLSWTPSVLVMFIKNRACIQFMAFLDINGLNGTDNALK